MSISVKVYDNGDHTCLVWLPLDGQPIAGCRGFTIHRLCNKEESYLHGFVGFSDADTLDPAKPWTFPIQRFMWWDYSVKIGDTIEYRVVPVIRAANGELTLDMAHASPSTPPMTITGQCTPHVAGFFNKGIVAAQYVARELESAPKHSKISDLVRTKANPLRDALSGLLRPRILGLLDEAKASNGQVFAALYELDDVELISRLTALGKHCHLILANGAFKGSSPPANDENHEVRARLKGTINLFDRIVTQGHFGHNKFVVFCDSTGKAKRVLTGSTNWTASGLCTQANNALIIDDDAVADAFLKAWKRIQAAGNGYPSQLVDGNSTAGRYAVDGCHVTPWFVKTSAAQDLEDARKLINAAKQGILFLFFNPGTFQQDPKHWTLLQNILDRHNQQSGTNYNPHLYFCGVVNQDIPMLTKPGAAKTGEKQPDAALDPSNPAPNPVTLFSNAIEPPQRLTHDVLVPHNIKDQFHDWEKELLGASMVNIHSKVIVLDPFGDKPVVMTGSHNLGFKASSENDDNLVIVEGNAPLAAAYAINIVAIFQTYRWNNYVEMHRKDPKVWHGPVDNDQWQSSHLSGTALNEVKFWLGQPIV